MSYLANPHRPYDSPRPPLLLPFPALPPERKKCPQHVFLRLPLRSALRAVARSEAPQSRRDSMLLVSVLLLTSCTIDHSFSIYPRLFRFSSALCTYPLTHFPFLPRLRLDTPLGRPQLCLSRPRRVIPSRRSGRPFNTTILAQVCPPR